MPVSYASAVDGLEVDDFSPAIDDRVNVRGTEHVIIGLAAAEEDAAIQMAVLLLVSDPSGPPVTVDVSTTELVRPVNTPERLAPQAWDELAEIAERALYAATGELLPGAPQAQVDADYARRKDEGPDDPPPPDRANAAAQGAGPPDTPGPPGR